VFEYFADNYVWNLAILLSLGTGGEIDEIDRACRPLLDTAKRGGDAGTAEFLNSWTSVADELVVGAEADENKGWHLSASAKYGRAANYLGTAERLQSRHATSRLQVYRRVLELFGKSIALGDPRCDRVEVPYGESSLPAYFVSASPAGGPPPCIIQWNGLDSTKEMMYQSGLAHQLARRGISTLVVDTPGSGEALRLRGLTSRPDTEVWAAACVDYLESRSDVAADRVGIVGWSLGGYYVSRAASFEKRLKLCVAWGANHNWGALQHKRLGKEGEHPVPHYWDHASWVWGTDGIDGLIELAPRISLTGAVEHMTAAYLIIHGDNDRQIPVADAYQSYEEAICSSRRELKIYGSSTGANEHIGIDNLRLPRDYIADWVADVLDTPGHSPSRLPTLSS
jgi:dienelactone hydrolase